MNALAILTVLLAVSTVTVPSGGLLAPDNAFYSLDGFAESVELGIGGFFLGDTWRIQKLNDNAMERLGETVEMLDRNQTQYVADCAERLNLCLNEMTQLAVRQGNVSGLTVCNEATVRVRSVLQDTESHLSQQTQSSVHTALQSSISTAEQLYSQTRTQLADKGHGADIPVDPPSVAVQPHGSNKP